MLSDLIDSLVEIEDKHGDVEAMVVGDGLHGQISGAAFQDGTVEIVLDAFVFVRDEEDS